MMLYLTEKYSSFTGDKLTQVNTALYKKLMECKCRQSDTYLGRVNQKPEYILKKGSDGIWRFSQYSVDPGSNATIAIYDAMVIY